MGPTPAVDGDDRAENEDRILAPDERLFPALPSPSVPLSSLLLPFSAPLDPTRAGDIDQNPAADDAVRVRGDVLNGGALGGYGAHRLPVIELPMHGDMTERVDVGVAVP